jgi:GntR family transcriptional regulator
MLSNSAMTPTSRFSTRPLYLQVRDALATRIATGEWKPTAAIPNESDLAREFGVSSGTMRKALDLLETERLLTRRQGRGTFVNDQASNELAVRYSNIRAPDGERISGEVTVTEISGTQASQAECARLRLRPHERVWRIQRVRLFRGEPFMVEDVSMPAALFPGLAERQDFSHRVVVMAQRYGLLLGKGEERLSIGTASPAIAGALRIAAGSPVLVLDRLVYALDGRPVEWRVGRGHFTDKYYLAEIN